MSLKRFCFFRPRVEPLEDRFLLAACHVVRLANINAGHDLGTGQARGSLPYCINYANNNPGPDTIDFNVTGTISPFATNLPVLASDMTIMGPGSDLLTISDCHSQAIFVIGTGATVTISGLTMTKCDHGLGAGGIRNYGTLTLEDSTVTKNPNWFSDYDGIAGGIHNSGTMTILRSTISHNEVAYDNENGYGAGIYNTGVMLIENSTISGNRVHGQFQGFGAGIFNQGQLEVRFSTITDNDLGSWNGGGGAGIHNAGPVVKLYNTIVAGNSGGPDIVGGYTGSANLIGGDPKLGVLQYNGGLTQTHKVLQMSPALNAGNNTGAPQWDQRGPGFPRIVNGTIDIGAFEVQSTRALGTAGSGDPRRALGGPAPSARRGSPDPAVLLTAGFPHAAGDSASGSLALGAGLPTPPSCGVAPLRVDEFGEVQPSAECETEFRGLAFQNGVRERGKWDETTPVGELAEVGW